MRKIIIALVLSTLCFAVTPFSLEGLKEINLIVADKGKVLKKETLVKIRKATILKLQEMEIKTETNKFSNLIIKIDAHKVGKKFAVNVAFFIIESVNPIREKELENVGITYSQNDFFIADDLDEEVYESAVDFLLYTFEDQFTEEN